MYEQPNSVFYSQKIKESVIQNFNSRDESKFKVEVQTTPQVQKPVLEQIQSLFTLEFYQEYFDVTSEIVVRRVINAFNPFSGTFFEIGAAKPDLYGPFWIITTLVFTMAAAANISAFLQLSPGQQFIYQFQFVPFAALILYSKGLVFPALIKVILSCFGSKYITFAQIICLYGYSSAITIPVLLLECIQNPAVQWILLLYAIFGTTMFLITNLNSELKYIENQNSRYIIIAMVGCMQITIMIFYKVQFFSNREFASPLTQQHEEKHLPYH